MGSLIKKGSLWVIFCGSGVRRKDIAENFVDICLERGLSLRQSIGLLEGLTVLFDRIEGYPLVGTTLYPVSDNSAITRTAHLFFERHAHRGEQGNLFSILICSVLSNCQKRRDLFHKSLREVNPKISNSMLKSEEPLGRQY